MNQTSIRSLMWLSILMLAIGSSVISPPATILIMVLAGLGAIAFTSYGTQINLTPFDLSELENIKDFELH